MRDMKVDPTSSLDRDPVRVIRRVIVLLASFDEG